MSPQARFRRGLLKCLYSWHCHSRTLKKTADWYFGKTYSSFYCNSRKLKSCNLSKKSTSGFLLSCSEEIKIPSKYGVIPSACIASYTSIRKFITMIPEKCIVRPYIFQFCPSFHIRRVFIQIIDLCISHSQEKR